MRQRGQGGQGVEPCLRAFVSSNPRLCSFATQLNFPPPPPSPSLQCTWRLSPIPARLACLGWLEKKLNANQGESVMDRLHASMFATACPTCLLAPLVLVYEATVTKRSNDRSDRTALSFLPFQNFHTLSFLRARNARHDSLRDTFRFETCLLTSTSTCSGYDLLLHDSCIWISIYDITTLSRSR